MKKFFPILFILCFTMAFTGVKAQIIDVRRAVKNKVENRINNKIDQAIDKSLDNMEKAARDSAAKKSEAEAKKAGVTEKTQNDADNQEVEAAGDENPDQPKVQDQAKPQSIQTYSKFDFTPGEKVIFFEDFSQDAVGDFPARWNTNVSGEVVTTDLFPGHWFQIQDDGVYVPDLPGEFPENYTIEFDAINLINNDRPEILIGFAIGAIEEGGQMESSPLPGKSGVRTAITAGGTYYWGYDSGTYILDGFKDYTIDPNLKYHVSIWIQKQRMRLYINESKLLDLPRVLVAGQKHNLFRFQQEGQSCPLISNIRIAVGQPDMRSKLITEGKLVTYGIYFDVNSDKVKPESYGTLKSIASVLTENPDVKVRIIGHTDSDGNDAANLDLSKRRAASVKAELSKTFGIDAGRMETDGKGETAPIAPNDNVTNKALNRRVEFLKL